MSSNSPFPLFSNPWRQLNKYNNHCYFVFIIASLTPPHCSPMPIVVSQNEQKMEMVRLKLEKNYMTLLLFLSSTHCFCRRCTIRGFACFLCRPKTIEILYLHLRRWSYRVFIKYCVFSLKCCDCRITCVWPAIVYTHWYRGETEKSQSPKYI